MRAFWSNAAYALIWIGTNLVLRPWLRLRAENLPRLRGPYVIVANHSSFLDPVILSAVMRRRISFMMTATIFSNPRTGWFYRFMRAIPVQPRGGNREAIRAAREALDRGEVVGVFPEGGISRDGQLYLGHPGAVSLVLSAGVPVVPVGLIGVDRALPIDACLPRPAGVRVRFGAPIDPDELTGSGTHRKQRLTNATERIMAEIGALTGQTSREAVLRSRS